MLTPEDAFNAIKTLYPDTVKITTGASSRSVLVFSGGSFGFTLYGVDIYWGDLESFPIIPVSEITLEKNAHGYYLMNESNYLHNDLKFRNSTYCNCSKKYTGYFKAFSEAIKTAKKYNPEIKVIVGNVG